MVGKDFRPPYFDLLVEFYADPSEQRTIKQFCVDNNLVEGTIFQYKRDHGDILFQAVDNVRAKYIPKIRSAAYAAVFANIKKSFQDRQLALKLCGDLIDKVEDVTTIRTPEEKRARIEELLNRMAGKANNVPVGGIHRTETEKGI